MHHRFVIALTGASGMPYGVRLLTALKDLPKTESHLILSEAALKVLEVETPSGTLSQLESLATVQYAPDNLAAPPASGSWPHSGMVICPCSMASLAAVSQGLGSNLIHRAADVTLKEKRPLVVVPRETPLNQIHLQNMLTLSKAGATILPASPGFYHNPAHIGDLVDHLTGRILDQLGLQTTWAPRWGSATKAPPATA
ncbi:MAG: UbiX family flavin prenyltransferase [Desulfohalobium sp.]